MNESSSLLTINRLLVISLQSVKQLGLKQIKKMGLGVEIYWLVQHQAVSRVATRVGARGRGARERVVKSLNNVHKQHILNKTSQGRFKQPFSTLTYQMTAYHNTKPACWERVWVSSGTYFTTNVECRWTLTQPNSRGRKYAYVILPFGLNGSTCMQQGRK